jgi:phage-related protein
LLEQGAEGIQALREEAQKLGLQFDNESAAAAENFIDAQLRLSTVFNNIKGAIGAELMPAIQGLIDRTREWVDQNKKLIKEKLVGFVRAILKFVRRLRPAFDSVVASVKRIIPIFTEWAEKIGRVLAEDLEGFIDRTVSRIRVMLPALKDGVAQMKEWLIIIGELIADLFKFIQSVGGLERALKVGAAAWVALSSLATP